MKLSLIKILFLSVSICIFISSNAQYKFGVLGGIGSSNFWGRDFPSENTPKLGIIAGLYFEREINLTLSFSFEFNYDQKGTEYSYYSKVGSYINANSRLEYISLPMLMKAYVGRHANYYFYTGISWAYLTKSSNKVFSTENGYTQPWETFFPYQFRKFDSNLLLGFGVNFREIILDLRYHLGIVDVYNGHNPPSIKNSFLSITLGYSIYKKKVVSCFNPNRKL
jgi:hypothetical protein